MGTDGVIFGYIVFSVFVMVVYWRELSYKLQNLNERLTKVESWQAAEDWWRRARNEDEDMDDETDFFDALNEWEEEEDES